MIARSRYAIDAESNGLLEDLGMGEEFGVLVMVAVCFFIAGAIFGRLSVPQAGDSVHNYAVYGRFGHQAVVTRPAIPPVAPPIHK